MRKADTKVERGYRKNVVYLKNTGSPFFEEAYLIVREDMPEQGCPSVPRSADTAQAAAWTGDDEQDRNMMEEADRIIRDADLLFRSIQQKTRKFRFRGRDVLQLLIGALISATAFLVFFLATRYY